MNVRLTALSVAIAGLLVACGGGGSSTSDSASPATEPSSTAPATDSSNSATTGTTGGTTGDATDTTTTPSVVVKRVTLTGVVATGAAMPGATVTAKCATGIGSAVSNTVGAYSLQVTDGVLPCLLEAVSADKSVVLHSVATSVTAHVSPITDMLVTQIAGTEPGRYFADAATAGKLATTFPADRVAAAQKTLLGQLQEAGLDTSALTDVVIQALVPPQGATQGNAHDKTLDSLSSMLSGIKTSSANFAAQLSANAAAAANPDTDVALLPTNLLLKPKAATCSALRSGTYRLLKLAPSADTISVTNVSTFTFDASSLTATGTDGVKTTWTANGHCRFTTSDGADVAVSGAGVLVARATVAADDATVRVDARSTKRMYLGFPEQSLTLADVAGTWNTLDWYNTGTPSFNPYYAGGAGVIVIGDDGVVNSQSCYGQSLTVAQPVCTVSPVLPGVKIYYTPNVSGGFDLAYSNGNVRDRMFAYRAGNGASMLLRLRGDGSFSFRTKQRASVLPQMGAQTTRLTLNLDALNLATPALNLATSTVTSVNAATGTFTRDYVIVGSESLVSKQTITFGDVRPGYIHRLASSGAYANGTNYTVSEWFGLQLSGMGIAPVTGGTATATSANSYFAISVYPPTP